MQKERASKKQQELLSFVDGFIKGNGYGPSYREIMRALGYKSVSTVAIHIDGLIAKGYLARRDNSARSLEVISTHSNDQPRPNTTHSFEAELRGRLKNEFTDLQRQQVKEALILLGFNELAKILNVSEDNE